MKRSRKDRGGKPGRTGRVVVGRARMPVFELLELRALLSGNTYTPATSVADSANLADNNLRSAVAAANADAGTQPDTIQLTSGTYTLSLGELTITNTAHTLIIDGQGASGPNATIIDQTAVDRLFQVDAGVTVIFENLEIAGGTAETDSLGGTTNAEGGGILSSGTLTLDDVLVFNNIAEATVAGEAAYGGGIYSTGTLTVQGAASSTRTTPSPRRVPSWEPAATPMVAAFIRTPTTVSQSTTPRSATIVPWLAPAPRGSAPTVASVAPAMAVASISITRRPPATF